MDSLQEQVKNKVSLIQAVATKTDHLTEVFL